jgi:hypothetical protein
MCEQRPISLVMAEIPKPRLLILTIVGCRQSNEKGPCIYPHVPYSNQLAPDGQSINLSLFRGGVLLQRVLLMLCCA